MLFFRHYTTFFHCIPNLFPSKFLFFIIFYFHILHPSFQTIKKAVLDLAFPLVDKQQKRLYFFYIYKKGRLEFFFLKSASIFFLFSFVSVRTPQVAQNRPKASMVFYLFFSPSKHEKSPYLRALRHCHLFCQCMMVRYERFELSTLRLKGVCSAN